MADNQERYISGEEHAAHSTSHNRHGRKVAVPASTVGLVIGAIILCIISFTLGVSYQKHHSKALTTSSRFGASSGFAGGGFAHHGAFGQVTSISPTSITISNQRTGSSSTYTITSSTTISDNGQTVTTSDIQTGDTVVITASTSSSTTASAIIVNPSFGGGAGGGFGSSPPQQSSGSSTSGSATAQ